jgi:S1-C subfamily serine protease
LGFQLQEVNINAKIKHHYHLPNDKGLFVVNVEENSPASRSQVMAGDIITSFNNKPVQTLHQLFKELTKKEILTLVDISVIRHTEMLNVGIFPAQRA